MTQPTPQPPSETPELKPCPFCAADKWESDKLCANLRFLKHDPKCYIKSGGATFINVTHDEIVDAWNNQTIETRLRAAESALAEAKKDSELLDWFEERADNVWLNEEKWNVSASSSLSGLPATHGEAGRFRDAVNLARKEKP